MPINVTLRGSGLLLTIDRPPLNTLDLETVGALRAAFASVAANPPAAGVVLTGAGERAFSAGVDTRAFSGYDTDQRRAMVPEITNLTAALLAIACPVVALVHGQSIRESIDKPWGAPCIW